MGTDDALLAETAKQAGNTHFRDKKYQHAIDSYTQSLEHQENAAVLCNRALCHSKLEEYGSAVADASRALELDPTFIKAYYRRGDANFALGKCKLALKDLRSAAKVAPQDRDVRKKLGDCEREVKRLKFEEALAVPEAELVLPSNSLDLDSFRVEDNYQGPRMQGSNAEGYTLTLEFVKDMLQAFKDQKIIHKRFAYEIIIRTHGLLKAEASLVDIQVPDDGHITVCGDTHGQFYDLLHIWDLNGLPSPENAYLFNGDFVDRGSFSLEVILSLFAFKALYPNHMYLTRGNHETKNMNKIYGFDGEVKAKYSMNMAELFHETFCWLPLAFVMNGKVMVVHGGLFTRDDVTLDEIRKIDRFREPPDEGVMCEALWSDPSPVKGRTPSKRGVGVMFGSDVTKTFLDRNNLELIVRSHEVKDGGYELEHDGRLVTVFSAPNYCDQAGNKGAFIRFNGHDMVPHFTTFEAQPHPNVKPMAYANSFMFGM